MKQSWLVVEPHVRLCVVHAPVEGGRPLLLANGRGEFTEKYSEVIGELNERGFDVWTFDWRGQGRSSRLIPHPQMGWVRSYDDYVRDLSAVLDHMAPSEPPVLLAHSMGGHIAQRFLARHPGRFERAVLSAPMSRFHPRLPGRTTRVLGAIAARLNLPDRYLFTGDYGLPQRTFAGNPLTSDRERFQRAKIDLIDKYPELKLGGGTLQWFRASMASMRTASRESWDTPTLLVVAGADTLVDNAAIRDLHDRLPESRLLEIASARHEILFESDSLRQQFWQAFDAFTHTAPR